MNRKGIPHKETIGNGSLRGHANSLPAPSPPQSHLHHTSTSTPTPPQPPPPPTSPGKGPPTASPPARLVIISTRVRLLRRGRVRPAPGPRMRPRRLSIEVIDAKDRVAQRKRSCRGSMTRNTNGPMTPSFILSKDLKFLQGHGDSSGLVDVRVTKVTITRPPQGVHAQEFLELFGGWALKFSREFISKPEIKLQSKTWVSPTSLKDSALMDPGCSAHGFR